MPERTPTEGAWRHALGIDNQPATPPSAEPQRGAHSCPSGGHACYCAEYYDGEPCAAHCGCTSADPTDAGDIAQVLARVMSICAAHAADARLSDEQRKRVIEDHARLRTLRETVDGVIRACDAYRQAQTWDKHAELLLAIAALTAARRNEP